MGKLSRDKGANHERLVARKLREIFPGAKRLKQGNTYDNRVEEPDVEAGPFDIECKHKKNLSRPEAIRDAKKFVREGRVWATVCREHGAKQQDIEITMPLQDFISLIKDLQK